MKKRKILSWLLCLSLLLSLTSGMVVNAAEETSTKGMVISKDAVSNGDGTYTISLEAYATGNKVITEVKEDIPTDIILVLDQSGSMSNSIGTVSFSQYSNANSTNANYYSYRHNGGTANLYYPLGNNKYASVSVTLVPGDATYSAVEGRNNNSSSYYGYINLWENQNNLYVKVNNKYEKVIVTRSGYSNNYTYTYSLSDGTVLTTSSERDGKPNFSNAPIDDKTLYLISVDESANVYTYTYTDANGNTQTIGTSTGSTNRADTALGTKLYQRSVNSNAGGSRLNALKTAVTTFVNQVSTKAKGLDGQSGTDDDVDHRIAVIGFASTKSSGTYKNTELLSTSSVINYANATSNNYKDALVSINGTNGQLNSRVSTAINELAASGDTYLEYGMDMANKVFAEYPIASDDTSNRQRIVVVFTDGYPAPSGTNDFDYDMADNAVSNAKTTKNTYNATVYTVGVFNAADPTADIVTGFAYDGTSSAQQMVAANRYMHYVSSNYPNAENMQTGNAMSDKVDPFRNGDSYYLSAADADTLNNIFQQISDQIESGGSSTTLSEETVIKDIIAPAFELLGDANASNITLKTYSCTGKDSNGYTWSENKDSNGNPDKMGATVVVNGNTVDVTGFDFAENYVGTVTEGSNVTYRGSKLVISFTVTPKAGFLGGNNVYTNTSAGVYENASATTPVMTFERPQVNVPIGAVTVTAQNKNVYLLGDLSADQLQSGAIVKVGNVPLDMSETVENYGLESWQNEYVNIDYRDASGNLVGALTDLVRDTTYEMSVTVNPNTTGVGADGTAATKQTGSGSASVNVFKPQLTFKDSTVWYGDTVPTSYDNDNFVETEWLHGTTKSTDVTMTGTSEPTISKTYTPDANKISDGKINSKQDIGVDVAVAIDSTDIADYTTFLHNTCTEKTCTLPTGSEFLLHVNTCQLTVKKSGGETGEPYVITVKKDGNKYTVLTLNSNGEATIYELPVGNYTIEENKDWSWRYNSSYSDSVELGSTNPTGTITCTNTPNSKIYWLNGFSTVVQNIFGVAK